MFRRKFLTAALVAAVAALGGSPRVDAGYKAHIEVYDLTAATSVLGSVDLTGVSSNIAFDSTGNLLGQVGLELAITSHSSHGSSGGDSQLSNITSTVQNITGHDYRITIQVTDTTYTSPGGTPRYLQSNLDSSQLPADSDPNPLTNKNWANGLMVQGTFQSYASMANNEYDFTGTQTSSQQVLSDSIHPNHIAVSENDRQALFNGGTPFSMTNEFVIDVRHGMADGTFAQLTGTTVVSGKPLPNVPIEGVPAPAGLVLAFTAVPFFGMLRRRMKTVPTT